MADKLTREQQMAVDDRGGKLLVSAAAGSGKTKVLVDRLMKYLEDPISPADLDEFLIITYTKAAASELRGKIAAKLTEKIAENPESRLQQQMQRLFLTKISTVHGFCADILREMPIALAWQRISGLRTKMNAGSCGIQCCLICWTGPTKMRRRTRISGLSWIPRVWAETISWFLS
jgi:superfamily I DNA/RNA helicase